MRLIARFVTVRQLMRQFGLPWQRAEAIIGEQTARTRRRPLVMVCYLGAFLMGTAGVPLLVPPAHPALALMLRLGCLAVLVIGLLWIRVLASGAILDVARAERRRSE